MDDIENKKVKEYIEFIKVKTDSFLLTGFSKKNQRNFEFEFTNCGYSEGEFHSLYQFLNSDKREADDVNDVTHNYIFVDKNINLKIDIDIHFYLYRDQRMELGFATTDDDLKYLALKKIYNRGLIDKIKARIIKSKFKNPYTIIEVDKRDNKFNIILKDTTLPHNYFII